MTAPTPAEQADAWNAAHPVGTRVRYWPGTHHHGGSRVAETRTPAWAIPSGSALVSITGQTGGVKLTHLDVVAADTPLTPVRAEEAPLTRAERAAAEWVMGECGRCLGHPRRAEEVAPEAREIVAAVAPHIEAEVRAKVAAEIRALPLLLDDTPHRYCAALDAAGIVLTDDTSYAEVADAGYLAARSDAARVAEGGERHGA